jgi:energy-coupling factor transport system permease protein
MRRRRARWGADPVRLHPFTPFLLTIIVALLAILLPPPVGPVALMLLVALVLALRQAWRTLLAAVLVSLPLWFFLLLLHGVISGGEGWAPAVAQAARLTAIILASLSAYRDFEPARFLDAAATRGWSSGAALLVLATLQAAPRLRARVVRIVEAQRARGLVVRGRALGRLRALVPVALPLMLHTLGEVDARSMALDTRAAGSGTRTALSDEAFSSHDYLLLVAGALAVLGAVLWRIVLP